MTGLFVKKGDTVKILSGKDKGKTGKILRAFPKQGRLIVEHINFQKKHQRPTRDNPKGGILEKEGPIYAAKVMVICPNCSKPTRISRRFLADGRKVRYCRKCKEDIDK
ncbi:MAG: 50S ribosomal protein L24 [Candidatus Hydrogenedentota bacterium]